MKPLTVLERLSMGIWTIVFLVATIANWQAWDMIYYLHNFAALPLLIVVIAIQFIALIQIYMIAKGKQTKQKRR
ncbi:MAG: hypothetical protein QXS81_04760 [Candidatus Micrarchaeaceae archaeon]